MLRDCVPTVAQALPWESVAFTLEVMDLGLVGKHSFLDTQAEELPCSGPDLCACPPLLPKTGVLRPAVLPPLPLPLDCLEVWLLEAKVEIWGKEGRKSVLTVPSWAAIRGPRFDP